MQSLLNSQIWAMDVYNISWMGKFYVVIQVATKTYKLCREDVKLVHSIHKIKLSLPAYAHHRDLKQSKKEVDTASEESTSLQFEPI
jgi:hypothetical protein